MHFLSMQGIFLNQLILRLGKLNILNLTQRKESCNAYLHVCSRPSDFSHEISQKFSRLPPLGAIFLSAPSLTLNPGSAPARGQL